MLETDRNPQGQASLNGRHEFGDACPATIDTGTAKGLVAFIAIYARGKSSLLSCAFLNVGMSRFLVPFEAIAARKRVREYISTTEDQAAISEFQAPNVFDSNKFTSDTIVRLTPMAMARASFFHNDSTPVPLYDHRTKVVTENPRGWVETSMPTDKIRSLIPPSYIGVIRKLPGVANHVIIYFENNQQKIMTTSIRPYVETEVIAVGKEVHFGVVGQFFNSVGFRIDIIASYDKVEILAIGNAARERAKMPPERDPARARAFGYLPV